MTPSSIASVVTDVVGDGVTWVGSSSTRVSDIQQQQQYTGPCQVVQHSGDASVDKDDIMSDQVKTSSGLFTDVYLTQVSLYLLTTCQDRVAFS